MTAPRRPGVQQPGARVAARRAGLGAQIGKPDRIGAGHQGGQPAIRAVSRPSGRSAGPPCRSPRRDGGEGGAGIGDQQHPGLPGQGSVRKVVTEHQRARIEQRRGAVDPGSGQQHRGQRARRCSLRALSASIQDVGGIDRGRARGPVLRSQQRAGGRPPTPSAPPRRYPALGEQGLTAKLTTHGDVPELEGRSRRAEQALRAKGQGVDTLWLGALAALAARGREEGIEGFRHDVLSRNQAMFGVLEHLGASREFEAEGVWRVELAPPARASELPDSPAGRAFLAAAKEPFRFVSLLRDVRRFLAPGPGTSRPDPLDGGHVGDPQGEQVTE